jgi:hypothetical protein
MLGLTIVVVAISAIGERRLLPVFLPNATGGNTKTSKAAVLH